MLNVSVCDGMGGSWERGVMGNNCPIYPIFPPPPFFFFILRHKYSLVMEGVSVVSSAIQAWSWFRKTFFKFGESELL